MTDSNYFIQPPVDFHVQGTQKVLFMIFIVDTSGSMKNDRMDAVNLAFKMMIPQLQTIQSDAANEFELKIAILSFNQIAEWLVTPTPISEFSFTPISCSKYVTFYSEAFKELNTKLSRSAFIPNQGKIAAPYIMFMTDGKPSENDDWQPALEALNRNTWFINSQRFAVLMGDEAISSSEARTAVAGFASDPEEGIIDAAEAVDIAAVVQAKTLHTIKKTVHNPVTDEGKSNQKPNDTPTTVDPPAPNPVNPPAPNPVNPPAPAPVDPPAPDNPWPFGNGGDNPWPTGGSDPWPTGGDNPWPTGNDNPWPFGDDNNNSGNTSI